MEFSIQASAKITAEHAPGAASSKHKCTDLYLEVSDNLDRSKYLDAEGLPTAEGSKADTQCLIQGLAANIHAAHQKGFRDSAEHFRYVLSELERAFIHVTNISSEDWNGISRTGKSNYTPPKKRRR
jgi:hypothetical protein